MKTEHTLRSLTERFVDDSERLSEEELDLLLRHLRERPGLAEKLGDDLISDHLLSCALDSYRQDFAEQVIQRIEDRESRTDFNSRVLSALGESPGDVAAAQKAKLHERLSRPANGNRLRAVREPGIWAYRKRQKRFTALTLSFAAAAVLIACFLVYDAHFARTPEEKYVAEIAGARPDVVIEHGGERVRCVAGRRLCEGDVIRLGEGQNVSFTYKGGAAKVEIEENTALRIGPVTGEKRLCLLYGRMEMEVAPQPAGCRFVVETPHAVAMVKGTRLVLGIERDFTRLDVMEGVVAFRSRDENEFTDILAGQYAVGRIGQRLVLGTIGVELEPQQEVEGPGVRGLVGHWRLGEEDGTSVPDASGSGNAGILRVGPRSPGKLHENLNFSNGRYVQIENHPSLNPTSEISICFRVKAPMYTTYGMMVSKHYNAQYAVMWYGASGRIRFDLWPWFSYAGPHGEFFGDVVLSLNEWHHVACTFDGSRARIYVDGVLDRESREVSGQLTVTDHPLCLGRNSGGGYPFRGILDEVRIYDRALSPEEVGELASMAPANRGKETGSHRDGLPGR